MKSDLETIASLLEKKKITLAHCTFEGWGISKLCFPRNDDDVKKRLTELADLYTADGNFNAQSQHAEKHAITLVHLERWRQAYKLFKAITGEGVFDIPLTGKHYASTADQYGQLGFEGLSKFSLVVRQLGYNKVEEGLLSHFIDCKPKCYPGGMSDARLRALGRLVSNFGRDDLKGKLEEARSYNP